MRIDDCKRATRLLFQRRRGVVTPRLGNRSAPLEKRVSPLRSILRLFSSTLRHADANTSHRLGQKNATDRADVGICWCHAGQPSGQCRQRRSPGATIGHRRRPAAGKRGHRRAVSAAMPRRRPLMRHIINSAARFSTAAGLRCVDAGAAAGPARASRGSVSALAAQAPRRRQHGRCAAARRRRCGDGAKRRLRWASVTMKERFLPSPAASCAAATLKRIAGRALRDGARKPRHTELDILIS